MTSSTTSAYATRLAAQGLDCIGGEVPAELGKMMRAAAEKDGVKIAVWIRTAWASHVNTLGLTRTVTVLDNPEWVEEIPWVFDMAILDPKVAAQRAADALKAAQLKVEADAAAQRAELEELRAFKAAMDKKNARRAA